MSNEESVSPPVEAADDTAVAVNVLCELQDSTVVAKVVELENTIGIDSDIGSGSNFDSQPSSDHYLKFNQELADKRIADLLNQVSELKLALSNSQKKASAQKCRANGKISVVEHNKTKKEAIDLKAELKTLEEAFEESTQEGIELIKQADTLKDQLNERDETIAKWQEDHPDEDVYEDRELEVTSICKINIDKQISMVLQALGQEGKAA